SHLRQAVRRSHRGVALVVILAFVVLLTIMALAFFSYSTLQMQISSSSTNLAKVDVFSKGAIETIIGDLKQEVAAGSTTNVVTSGGSTATIFLPTTIFPFAPAISGFTTNSAMENLVKISRSGTAFYSGSGYSSPGVARAADLSTTVPSQNGR